METVEVFRNVPASGPVFVDLSRDTTNYFDTEYARRGVFYAAYAKKRFLVMVPPRHEDQIPEMQTGKKAIAQCGVDRMTGLRLWRIVFDDGSRSPYTLHIGVAAGLPLGPQNGASVERRNDWTLELWTRNGKRWSCPCIVEVFQNRLPATF